MELVPKVCKVCKGKSEHSADALLCNLCKECGDSKVLKCDMTSDSQNLASCILTPISPSLSRIYTAKFTLLAIRDFLNTFSSRDREW